jgi:Na+-driven multidrug efflux pump
MLLPAILVSPSLHLTVGLTHLHHFARHAPTDLNPPEPAVAMYATQFIKVRALGIAPALVGYVAIAVFRGHKDTRTPLYAAGISAACNLTLHLALLYGEGGSTLGSGA